MLIGNLMVKEFYLGGRIPCISGITALNIPLVAETRALH